MAYHSASYLHVHHTTLMHRALALWVPPGTARPAYYTALFRPIALLIALTLGLDFGEQGFGMPIALAVSPGFHVALRVQLVNRS